MKQKWHITKNEAEVCHSTVFLGCRIEVRNHPGTRSLDGVIFNRSNLEWNRILCDKLEWSVKALKEECLVWVQSKISEKKI